jgi:ABC-type phosphate/phosphonate transport system, permease component
MERATVGIYESLCSTRANLSQVVMFAVVPSILPEMVGYTLYIFAPNVRVASILGGEIDTGKRVNLIRTYTGTLYVA